MLLPLFRPLPAAVARDLLHPFLSPSATCFLPHHGSPAAPHSCIFLACLLPHTISHPARYGALTLAAERTHKCRLASRRSPQPSFACASYVASGHWQGRARAPPRPSSVVGSRRLGHEIRSAQATAGRHARDQPRAGACSTPACSALPPAAHRSGRPPAPASSSVRSIVVSDPPPHE